MFASISITVVGPTATTVGSSTSTTTILTNYRSTTIDIIKGPRTVKEQKELPGHGD